MGSTSQINGLLIQNGTMLDGVDSGTQCILYAIVAFGMCHDPSAVSAGFFDNHCQFRRRPFRDSNRSDG